MPAEPLSFANPQDELIGRLALTFRVLEPAQLSSVLQEKGKAADTPLLQRLVETKVLPEADRQWFDPIVAALIQNAEKDAAILGRMLSKLRDSVEREADSAPPNTESTLTHATDRQQDTSVAPTRAFTSSDSPANNDFLLPVGTAGPSRYRILRSHAKGGLGEVFLARDLEVNRDVALKEIQPRYADDRSSRARFLVEAELTGRLEHPGIVPVYGIGRHADGRPFYAMRFIAGESLQEAAERYHHRSATNESFLEGSTHSKPKHSHSGVGLTGVEFRQLLGRFIAVCQAIDYAHSRAVIHRDIKPANIMLGQFGETLVVDWGLAKSIARPDAPARDERPPSEVLLPRAPLNEAATQAGTAIGTPAFMSPEQATGNGDRVGTASDIYSLGATLYFLLTGCRPFRDNELRALLYKVQTGRFPAPGKANAAVPKPLEAICLRAMSTEPESRYASAGDLARDLERYLADEPVSALTEPVTVRAKRWLRKHPRIVATLAASLVVGISSSLIIATVVAGKNRDLKNSIARETKAKSAAMRAQGLAEANELAARQQSTLALSTLSSVIYDIQEGLANVPGSTEIRRRLLTTSLEKLASVTRQYLEQAVVDQRSIAALIRLGDLVLAFGAQDTRLDPGVQAAISSEQRRALQVAESIFRKAESLAQQRLQTEPDAPEARHELASVQRGLGRIHLQSGEITVALGFLEQHMSHLEELAAADPSDRIYQRNLSLAMTDLGEALEMAGRHRESLLLLERAEDIRKILAAGDPADPEAQRDLLVVFLRQAQVLSKMGTTAQSRVHYEQAHQLASELLSQFPENRESIRDFSLACVGLGKSYLETGDTARALEYFQQRLDIARELADAEPGSAEVQSDVMFAYDSMGDVELTIGNYQAAQAWYSQAFDVASRLAGADPQSARHQRGLANANEILAVVANRLGQVSDAQTYEQAACEIRRSIVDKDPNNMQAISDLAISLQHRFDSEFEARNLAVAEQIIAEKMELDQRLVAAEPKNQTYQRLLAISYDRSAMISQFKGQYAEALELVRKQADITRELASQNPGSLQARQDVASAHQRLSDLHREMGNTDAALREIETGSKITQQLLREHPELQELRREAAFWLGRRGEVYRRSDQTAEAQTAYEESVEILRDLHRQQPEDATLQGDLSAGLRFLGNVHLDIRQFDQAKACFLEATELTGRLAAENPESSGLRQDLAHALGNLGRIELQRGKVAEALPYLDRALTLSAQIAHANPESISGLNNLMMCHYMLGEARNALRDYDGAVQEFERSIGVVQRMLKMQEGSKELQDQLAMLEDRFQSTKTKSLVFGDLERILTQPDAEVGKLLATRGYEMTKQAKIASAVEAAQAIEGLKTDDPQWRYHAACIYARCAVLSDRDEALDSNARESQKKEYISAAFTALKSAIQAGWNDFDQLKEDSDLDVLRELPDFQAMIRQ